MTHAGALDRLSAYLDDDLGSEERQAVRRHLDDCSSCRQALDELRRVIGEAHALPLPAPPANLWPSVLSRLTVADVAIPALVVPRRPVTVSLPVAIAASILIGATAFLGAWMVLNRPAPRAGSAALAAPDEIGVSDIRAASMAAVPYGHALDDLMTTLASRRERLNPRTVEVLDRSMATIDAAIADAVRVLAEHPDDLSVVARVAEQRRLKVAVLRRFEKLTVLDLENAQ
jgi:hypothetical protein